MFRIKASTFIVHAAGWLMFMSLPLIFSASPNNGVSFEILASWMYWMFFLVFMALFYGNIFFLIPRLFLKKKFVFYFSSLAILLTAICYIRPFDQLQRRPGNMRHTEFRRQPPKPQSPGQSPQFRPGGPGPNNTPGPRGGGPRVDVVSIFLFIMIVTLAMAIELGKRWRLTEQRIARAEADKANAELSFLKAQINPHFLFNTLNNIYSLAITKSENTADSIMKLSNIMRYVTDDATENYVSLEDEVECIQDYIALQRLRLGGKVYLDFSVSGHLEHKEIAPLILMTFIENVFKYGISNHEPANITIRIFAEQHTITFYSRNRVFRAAAEQNRKGIGIANTRQRLEHLYANRHLLNITEENDIYTVDLTLKV